MLSHIPQRVTSKKDPGGPKITKNRSDYSGRRRGRRTNRFPTFSHCVWVGSSFSWLGTRHACVSWVCSGVATFVATCVLMVVLVVSLLHGLAWALLHERMRHMA